MKNFKSNKAITLIALIITVIVMMILAGVTVYLTFNGGGIIGKVKQTSIIQELKEVEEQVMLRIEEERLNKFSNNEKFNISDYTSLESFSPKIESKYSEYIRIENGKMYIKTNAPEEIKKVAEKIGIQIKDRINNIRIYGNSIQAGTPSPENPVEIQSVGELVTDTNDPNYGKYKIPITASGKNLLKSTGNYKEACGVTLTYSKDSVTLNGTCTSSINLQIAEINLKAGTYTLKANANIVPANDQQALIQLWDGTNNQAVELKNADATGRGVTANINMDGSFLYRIRIEKGVTYDNFTFNPQLEKGDTATSYEPYVEPIATNIYLDEPLRKVGDDADYIDFSTGKIVRNIRKVIFDGSDDEKWRDDWLESSASMVYSLNTQSYTKNTVGINDRGFIMQNGNTVGSTITTYLKERDDIYKYATDTASWRAFLNLNNIYFIYPLLTPTEESINLPNISTLSGMKNVSVETQIQPSKIDVVM